MKVRHITFTFLAGILCICNAQGQTSAQNYVKSETVLVPGKTSDANVDALTYTSKRTHTEYFDGLGRPSQTNDYKASGDGSKDVITSIGYDSSGRQNKSYLPFASAQNMGYHIDVTALANFSVYGTVDDDYAFSQTEFEPSPLNRVSRQAAPGSTWHLTSDKEVKYEYGTNATDVVRKYLINSSGLLDISTAATVYAINTLYKTTTWNENNAQSGSTSRTVEFKDKQGQVVLKRSYDGATAFSTYYVYDNYGLLCCVIPPKATADDGTITSTELDQLCYQYKYDERNRLIEKKLPGAGWEFLVYDKRDRLVLTQDATQQASGYWMFTKYDIINRPVLAGKYESSSGRASLQSILNAESVMYESSGSVVLGYTNYAFPRITDESKYLSSTYYDNYTTPLTWGYAYSSVYSQHTQTNSVKGLVTGIKTKILGTSTWLYTVNYYDKFGRLLQQYQTNPEGGNNRVSYAYDFEGKVTDKQTYHKKTSASTGITLYENFVYDHMGRLLTSKFGYNTTTLTTLASNTYNEIGRLTTKQQHNGMQYSDYQYNVRGWLTKINNPDVPSTTIRMFAMELVYNWDISQYLLGDAQFNGNIGGIKWRKYNTGSSSNEYRAYNFTYDGLNRLTKADYGTYSGSSWTNLPDYDLVNVSYDSNGNISNLIRATPGGTREALDYTNTGNQLTSISGVYNSVSNKSGSFTYDANGNNISDGLRGIPTISFFTEIDLPKQYYKDASNKVDYAYDAQGNKWSKTATMAGSATTIKYYGPFIYEGTTTDPSKVLTSEGYYDFATSLYHYYLKDHLGNTRITYHYAGSTPVIDQEVEYYPFGALFYGGLLGDNKYLYNGKELNDEFFENYDYGARFYDPTIGRWHSIDPMAENYDGWSPYNFTLNNPICNYDPNGMWVETDTGYNTNDPDEISQFLRLFGIGPNNQPKDAEQAKDQESARKGASNVAKGIEKLYKAEREAISYIPFGSLLNEIIDQKTGYESDDNVGYNLGFEAAATFLPGVKFAKGPLKSIVRFTDETVVFFKDLPDGTAIRVINQIPEGFRKTKFLSEGQKVFSNGKVFISPDVTGHIGGRWKAATKVEYLKNNTTRIGTFDENLYKIGK